LLTTAIFLTLSKLHSNFFLVQRDSFEQLYSTKPDDELLALAADEASLRDDAKPILVDELRRRNLAEASRAKTSEFQLHRHHTP
jgi:hypothetical protein